MPRGHRISYFIRIFSPLLLTIPLVLGGCQASDASPRASSPDSGQPGESTSESGVSRTVVVGDWDDLEAAALAAVDAIDTVVVTTTPDGPDRVIFELKTVRNEDGRLIATKASATGPDRLNLEATIGRFGDAVRERRLLDAMAARLKQLHGVEFAPR